MDLLSAIRANKVKRGPNKTNIPIGPPYITQEDLDSEEGDPEGTVELYRYERRSVKRLPDGTVIKYTPSIRAGEAAAMTLAADSGLPVPKVYSFYENDPQSARYLGWIKMDFVDGVPLEDVWEGLAEAERLSICHQLRDILIKMRTIEPPVPGTISSCDMNKILDRRAIFHYDGGPFSTEAEFNDFVFNFVGHPPPALVRVMRSRFRTDNLIVLTHCDLSPRNIMVKDNKITGLLDWEFSGFFPDYWEYIKFFDVMTQHRDWITYSDEIMPQAYDDDLLVFQAVQRWRGQ